MHGRLLWIAAVIGLSYSHYLPSGSVKEMPNFDPDVANKLNADFWYRQSVNKLLQRKKQLKQNQFGSHKKHAKNIILFMGDGLGLSTVTATRKFKAEMANEEFYYSELSWDNFPFVGHAKIYTADVYSSPDSGSASTAMLSGIKTRQGYIGVDATAAKQCENTTGYVESIAHWAVRDGKAAGFVTNTRITHASPAPTYAHVPAPLRDYETYNNDFPKTHPGCKDIALQFVESAGHLRVALGGGWRNFLPNNTRHPGDSKPGKREDGRNLIEEWMKSRTENGKSASYVSTLNELKSVSSDVDYLLGMFSGSHMDYFADSPLPNQPRLADMTEEAVRILSTNDNGYFIFVESGRIDHAHHENRARYALMETMELNLAIERVLDKVDLSETLVLLTSDHSHTMSIGGYIPHYTSILGQSAELAMDDKPYTSLLYGNGPGAIVGMHSRANVTGTEAEELQYRQQAIVPLDQSTHAGEDVPVYAIGVSSELFSGTYELSYIPWAMACAANVTVPAYPLVIKELCKTSKLNRPISEPPSRPETPESVQRSQLPLPPQRYQYTVPSPQQFFQMPRLGIQNGQRRLPIQPFGMSRDSSRYRPIPYQQQHFRGQPSRWTPYYNRAEPPGRQQ